MRKLTLYIHKCRDCPYIAYGPGYIICLEKSITLKRPDRAHRLIDGFTFEIPYWCALDDIEKRGSGMTENIYSAQDPLEWCFECDIWGKTCKGTDHPVFCPKIDHDEPEFMENEVRE
jgi:hypothetical protein